MQVIRFAPTSGHAFVDTDVHPLRPKRILNRPTGQPHRAPQFIVNNVVEIMDAWASDGWQHHHMAARIGEHIENDEGVDPSPNDVGDIVGEAASFNGLEERKAVPAGQIGVRLSVGAETRAVGPEFPSGPQPMQLRPGLFLGPRPSRQQRFGRHWPGVRRHWRLQP